MPKKTSNHNYPILILTAVLVLILSINFITPNPKTVIAIKSTDTTPTMIKPFGFLGGFGAAGEAGGGAC
jgi:hypothetical protein